jgi:hypothetical protein
LTAPNVPSPPLTAQFAGAAGLEVVLSWGTPNTQIGLARASVKNAGGRVIANLTGKEPKGHHRRHSKKAPPPALFSPGVVAGANFETITVPRPAHGSSLQISVAASSLPGPSSVSIQIAPLQTLPVGTPGAPPAQGPPATPAPPSPAPPAPAPPGSGGEGGAPAPPANHTEEESPHHPVNTFANYHNASGVGPAIAAGQTVEVSCRVYDPTIGTANPDGYWYRIASSPWNNAYYATANTFLNGDPPNGPYSHNTDLSVPVC